MGWNWNGRGRVRRIADITVTSISKEDAYLSLHLKLTNYSLDSLEIS
jgi:hypothetical protein